MVKRLGIIFSGLLIVLLLSNINYNANVQVLAQQNTSASTNTSVPIASSDTVSNITKLTGGVKIISPDKGNLVPLNSNSSLVIQGVSKDNATSDCDVSVIINNVKPYQNVNPTGIQGANDYSNWQYTVSNNYTNINEGNNKITSKILCLDGPQTLQAYYSVNITATNFTQAQLSSYTMMLESSNSTANGGNMSQVAGGLQPFAQIQQFNQDTGNGPICCKTTASSSTGSGSDGSGSGGSSSSSSSNDDDDSSSSSSSNDDDDSSSSSRNNDDDSSSSSRNNDDDSSSINDSDFGFNFDESNDDRSGSFGSGVDGILNNVEDTMRSVGIDFSFN
ncbi:hypothetical protein [Candidatus Nitrosocosmicus arcticus]|uniref:Uncharacterized protein n=1 Tax=Candidatus Nitrosocosmicus arcticus TaxID=2035267 RepID=A0A557SWY0_9ARCH|nr:hypothetical protein [Candidatus Nitrosocosmicus arcticus]TVP41117.1 exported protein of unknown function [Candidatus Nitrosocosmicus arcticus]